MAVSSFGLLADGRPVAAVTLGAPDGVQAQVLTWGATLRSLSVPTPRGRVEVLLQLLTLADYEADTRFLNPVIGRCANRIGGAAFTLDGERFAVAANEGANCLHGGAPGWSKRLWRVAEAEDAACTLAYTSPDGESGFPGEVEAEVRFAIEDAQTLSITWRARTTRPTPVNLTHHLYFALSGADAGATIRKDCLRIAGGATTPTRPDLIPTGELRSVDAAVQDLRTPQRLGDVLDRPDGAMRQAKGLDLNWVLSGEAPAAEVTSPATDLRLQVSTDQPGLQVYTGQGLSTPFVPYGALVLEPQGLPDAVNQPNFPSVILLPGELYERSARYRFDVTGAVGG